MTTNDNIYLIEEDFGVTPHPITHKYEAVKKFTFGNKYGVKIQVITLGAIITSINLPDKNGSMNDIVLGFDTLNDYVNLNRPHFGSSIGRVCNRINKGEFILNGKQYFVSKNLNGKHHLHGGFIGFDLHIWTSYVQDKKVTMTHVSDNGTEGYPGTVIANVTFELKQNNQFCVSFMANASEPTPINLTNHSYFNLAGHEKGHQEIYNHTVQINADRITVTDHDSIPTGSFDKLSTNVNYDFRHEKQLGPAIAIIENIGFDDNYCVDESTKNVVSDSNKLPWIASVTHKGSGRTLKLFSDQPGVQFYTANFLPDPENKIYPNGKKHADAPPNDMATIIGKHKAKYNKHGAFCLETQKYPDAVNHANFESTIINPGETYTHNVVYQFTIEGVMTEDDMKKCEYKMG